MTVSHVWGIRLTAVHALPDVGALELRVKGREEVIVGVGIGVGPVGVRDVVQHFGHCRCDQDILKSILKIKFSERFLQSC